ncbi:MAG: bL9 family ribosomal protein [Ruthenibacterium sp.]
MKIVLKQDVKSIGKKDGVYEVSDGYARNFLFPRGRRCRQAPAPERRNRPPQNSTMPQKLAAAQALAKR